MSENISIRRLARRLAALERRLNGAVSTPQLSQSSIHAGTIDEYDGEGRLVGRIGQQPDGSHGYVVLDGPTPPTPTPAEVEGGAGFFVARWNGGFTDAEHTTHDHRGVEVHVAETPDFEVNVQPNSPTRHASIDVAGGGAVTIAKPAGTYYVRLVTRTAPGKYGEASAPVSVEVTPVLSEEDLEALEEALDEAAAAIETLRDVDLPALEQRLGDAEAAVQQVTDTDLPALDARLGDAEDAITTTLPNAIEAAKSAAETALLIAPVSTEAPTLADGEGRPVNAIWTRIDSEGNEIGYWRWTGTEWTAQNLTPTVIPNLSASKITSGTIDTARLNAAEVAAAVANVISLNADRITSGTIDTARLNAQEIAAAVATIIELNADRITSGTIDTDRLNASEVAAAVANVIELNADRITSGTINTARLNAQQVAAAVGSFLSLDASQITSGTIDTARLNATEIAAAIANFVTVKAENIQAGQIDVELSLGVNGEVRVGETNSGHVLIDPAVGVEYRVPGPESDGTSEPIPVSRMGRSYAVIDPATGDTLAALTEEGNVTGIDAEFQSLSVGGLDVLEEIGAGPLGVVASSGYQSTTRGPYTAETGVWELPFLAREGRRYRIEVIGEAMSPSGTVRSRFRYRTGLTADSVPAPTVNDPQIGPSPLQYWRGSENWNTVYRTVTYEPTQTRFIRVLFTIEPPSGQSASFRYMTFSVYDDGTQSEARGRHSLGGASGTTPDETPPPQTFDQQFWFDWSASYNQYGRSSAENYVGSAKMRQGKDAYTTNPYAAALRIPDNARSLMMGASKVEVWVRLTHAGPYSSGKPRFGRHTSSASSPPSTMPDVYGDYTPSKSLAKGGTYWYKLPADWAAGWIAGTYRGITLGRTNSASDFMDFYKHNYSDTSKRPRLRVRVTK